MSAAPVEMPLHDELHKLEARVVRMQCRPREIVREQVQTSARLQEAKVDLQDCLAAMEGGEKVAPARRRELETAVSAAQSALLDRQWEVEISGANQAAHNAADVVSEFVAEHAETLAEELVHLAFARRAEFVSRMRSAIEAWQELNEVGGMWGDITEHLPGGRSGNVIGRDPNVGDAVDRVGRLLDVEVVAPIPRSLAAGAPA